MILVRNSRNNKEYIRRRVRHKRQNNHEKQEAKNKQNKTESKPKK